MALSSAEINRLSQFLSDKLKISSIVITCVLLQYNDSQPKRTRWVKAKKKEV